MLRLRVYLNVSDSAPWRNSSGAWQNGKRADDETVKIAAFADSVEQLRQTLLENATGVIPEDLVSAQWSDYYLTSDRDYAYVRFFHGTQWRLSHLVCASVICKAAHVLSAP